MAAALSLAALVLLGGYRIVDLEKRLMAERAKAQAADERADRAEASMRQAAAEAAAALDESMTAAERAQAARAAAEQAAEKALSADELSEQMRRSALTAEQTAERALEEMQSAVERAQRLEAQLAESRRQIEDALSRARAAEELQRRTAGSAEEAAEKVKQAEARVLTARTDLQNRTRRFLEALVQAEKSVNEAASQHSRSVNVAGEAQRALELAVGSRRNLDDEGAPGSSSLLHDFRNMRQRSTRASERARQSLEEAGRTLLQLRRQLTQP